MSEDYYDEIAEKWTDKHFGGSVCLVLHRDLLAKLLRQTSNSSHGREWNGDWPKEPGEYWFYGYKFGKKEEDDTPRLHFVTVRRGRNCLVFVTDGHFLYREEGACGVWMNVILPELPTERD